MRHLAWRIALIAALAVVATATPAEDWPQWRGPNRDGISRETGLLEAWPEGGPKVIWEKPLGAGFSCATVAGGRVFTMAQADETESNPFVGPLNPPVTRCAQVGSYTISGPGNYSLLYEFSSTLSIGCHRFLLL